MVATATETPAKRRSKTPVDKTARLAPKTAKDPRASSPTPKQVVSLKMAAATRTGRSGLKYPRKFAEDGKKIWGVAALHLVKAGYGKIVEIGGEKWFEINDAGRKAIG